MQHTRIKFCGFTRSADAVQAVSLGVDEIGLIFAGGPRNIQPAQAVDIITAVRAAQHQPVTVTGLFMDPDAEHVHQILRQVPLDQLQFHGQETAEFCAGFERPWTKAIPAGGDQDIETAIDAWTGPDGKQPRAVIVDAHQPGEPGGQGKVFDWRRIPAQPSLPIYLAGGLSVDNVGQAVVEVRPYAVDVSSGIEDSPGIKNHATMQRFINEVRRADAQID